MNESTFILSAALLPLSLGVFMSYRVFRIPDITTDGSFSLGGALFVWSIMAGLQPILGILISVLGGALAGLVTGSMFHKLKIPALLAGILVTGALFSVNLLITGKANLPLVFCSTNYLFDIEKAKTVFIFAASLLVFLFMLYMLKSDFGLALRAAGSNQEASASQGIKVNKMRNVGLALANGMSALSGSLMVLSQGFWDINMGTGIIIAGMASVMIGESLSSRHGFFTHAILLPPSTLLYRFIIAQVLSFGLEPVYVKLLTSVMVALILWLTLVKKKNDYS
jgi:putative ABC transport system permease protein